MTKKNLSTTTIENDQVKHIRMLIAVFNYFLGIISKFLSLDDSSVGILREK